MRSMSQTKRRRGWKACDPYCSDKVRVALYNRPNGPHQGKLILGKTYLSGIDNKCFSRSGRQKKGYRNIPIDLEREFEIEKKQISKIRAIIRGPSEKQKRQKMKKKEQQKKEYEANKAQKMRMEEGKKENEVQPMRYLSRLPSESMQEFIVRAKETTAFHLNFKKNRNRQKKLKKREKKLQKLQRKKQQQIEEKRKRKTEHKQRVCEQKEFENKMKAKTERIRFGETNDRPPINLHKFGAKLFGKKVKKSNHRNENNLNVEGLSFANVIKERAQQMKKQEIMNNYARMKQKRNAKNKKTQKNGSALQFS